MEKEKIVDYVKCAIELETELYTQNDLKKHCLQEFDLRKPQLGVIPSPAEPTVPTADDYNKWPVELVWTAGATGGAFIVTGLVFIGLMPVFGVISLIIGVLCFVGLYKMVTGPQKEADKQYETYYVPQMEEYRKKCEDIRRENEVLRTQYNTDCKELEQSKKKIVSVMDLKIAETDGLLTKLYELDEIYPKYRNLPALTSIYEYLVTGRCDSLTGPHGAYNLYEDELRKDTVISQLNTVIENLEKIKQNQYMLYQQIKEIKKNTSVIASELKQIKGYTVQIAQLTALNTYYAGLNERNTRIMMYYHL